MEGGYIALLLEEGAAEGGGRSFPFPSACGLPPVTIHWTVTPLKE